MSRGKDVIDDALGAIYCQEAEMDEARDLIDALAHFGLMCYRDVEDAESKPANAGWVRDALAAFEKRIGFTYGRR